MSKNYIKSYMMLSVILLAFLLLGGCSNNEKGDVSSKSDDTVGETETETSEEEFVIDEETPMSSSDIQVNQVGYLLDAPKLAILEGEFSANIFQVIDAETREVVFKGEIPEAKLDSNSGEFVRSIDFSEVAEEGEYAIAVEGVGISYPFYIGPDVYNQVFKEALRSFTLGRSGINVDDPVTGLAYNAGHLQDAEAQLDYDHSSGKRGDILDVSGGWYDAGDFGKYTSPAAITVGQILLSYELNPSAYSDGQLAIPSGMSEEENSAWPDVLEEVKYELDWMMKMQRPDGAVYHKVAGLRWPGMISPDEDKQQRYVFGMSTYGTGMYAGALAMAARIYEPFDAAYAAKLLESAQKAQQYLESHPENEFLKSDRQDDGSGAYEKPGDQDERFWAAAELLKTTGDTRYADYLEENLSSHFVRSPGTIGWWSGLALGHFAYATSEEGDSNRKAVIKTKLTQAADSIVQFAAKDGYRYSLNADEYTWASVKTGMAKSQLILLANELEEKEEYIHGALDQLHYTLGRNSLGTTFVTGAGKIMPLNPHNRIIEGTGVYVPGLVVGGPNKFGGDSSLDRILKKEPLPPAKAFLDNVNSYSSNEYAIDYNAPYVFVLSYFAK